MAISYTQDQYNTIKTVADKMGSGNENFKSAVNKKYGEGGYDSYLSYKAPVNEGLKVNLDVTNQYRDKLGTGPQLEHTTTPQTTPETVSNVSGGFSNLKEVAPVVTPKATGMEAVTGGIVGSAGATGTTPITTPITSSTTPGATGYDTGAPVLDTELTQIQKDKNLKLEEQKKAYLLGKSQFEKNKGYYSNYDVLDKQYTGVVGDLITAGGNTGVVPEAKYQEIANKYGISLEEAKDPNSILKRGILTDEGKKILGVSKAESDIEQSLINNQRTKDDLKVQLDNTLTQIDQQVEDLGKQMARNVGWTEAMGAWSGALRGSGYLQGIQNIKDDATNTINRLKAQAERIKTANAKDVSRLTEDFNKSYAFAKEDLDKQVNDLKTNNILKLNEAQSTYGINSTKLKDVLDGINKEYGLKANESVSAYLKNLSAINSIAKENMSLIEESDKIADTKANKRVNEYLANGGANMMNATYNTLTQDVADGKMTVEKAQSLKNIMLSSIQATLGKVSPVSTQDLSTVNTLLSQGLSPSEVVAKMQSLAKFQPKATIDKTLDLGDRIRVQYSDGTTEDIKKGTEAMTEYQRAQMGKEAVMTPYQQAQIDIENKKLGKVGANEFTGASVSSGVTQNRPDRNKNPGNVKIGDVGYGVDNQNHTIFGSEVDGYNAMIKDLTTKFTGGSRHVSKLTGKKLGPESTLADLGSVYAEDPKWASNLASRSGYATSTKLKDIDINKLAPALAKIEGFTGTITEQAPKVGYTPSDIELLSTLARMDDSARNTALKAQGIPLSRVTDYMADAKAGKIPTTQTQKDSATQIMSNIQDIASMDWNDATGSNFTPFSEAPRGTDWATAESKINNLVASVTLPNLGMLKGPMSDKDLAFIQNASTKLAMAQSDEEFEKQLIELYNISANKAGLKNIKSLSEIPTDRILTKEQTGEGTTPTTGEGTTTPTVGRWQSKK